MEKREQKYTLLSLIEAMSKNRSWCGETHIQKAAYLLDEIAGVGLGYQFVLYKHGPYCFELRDDIVSLIADDFLKPQARPPYGPSILPSDGWRARIGPAPTEAEQNQAKVNFVAEKIGPKNVAELERLATAFFVTATGRESSYSLDQQAQLLVSLKPHITIEQAKAALEEMEKLRAETPRLLAA